MRIVILGAGIIGTTLAYVLTKRGHEVTVLDRQEGVARECSFSNGGQLSYSHAEPWACPSIIPKVISWLGQKDAPLVFNMRADPAMWRWTFQFLRHCMPKKSLSNMLTLLQLSQYSRQCMEQIQQENSLDFHYKQHGILRLFGSKRAWQEGIHFAQGKENNGLPFEIWDWDKISYSEPSLVSSSRLFYGGIYYPQDAMGDAYHFSKSLEEISLMHSNRIKFYHKTTITGFETTGDKITGVLTDKGNFTADAYVMALGAATPLLLKPLKLHLPIYPLKGYSVSIPISNDNAAPRLSITDMDKKMVYSRLGNTLRVAGTAELAGYDTVHTQHRIAPILRRAEELFPEVGDIKKATHWACLRPSTPDGIPILGASPYRNLYLNTGHGTLGWTLSAGSAYLLADMLEKKDTAIPVNGLGLERF